MDFSTQIFLYVQKFFFSHLKFWQEKRTTFVNDAALPNPEILQSSIKAIMKIDINGSEGQKQAEVTEEKW